MRGKEDAHDYRYFPEPDLMPVVLPKTEVEKIRASIPELKNERIARYTEKLSLPVYDAKILTQDKEIADLFDESVDAGANPKKASNYIMSEILRKGKTEGAEDVTVGIDARQLTDILKLVEDGTISLVASKQVLDDIWLSDKSAKDSVEKLGLKQNNDSGEIEKILQGIIDANPKVVADYRAGNEKVTAFFVGQVMKATKGKSNPKVVNELLVKLLK